MWSIIVHGGAKTIEPSEREANSAGCLAAIEAGARILRGGGSSIDAVEAAVKVLEDDPTFNAGHGSALNAEGEIEMCASVMEGAKLNVGAVTVLRGVRNPVSVARTMLFDEPILLAGSGARQYAADKGLELCSPQDLKSPEQKRSSPSRDTVGCVALDEKGNLAVAVSTGGLDGAAPGRVGDSPQPGCGYYADNAIGAVCFSGDGEQIARAMLAARVMHGFDAVDPGRTIEAALNALARVGGEAGAIALAPDGTAGWAHNSSHFAVAMASSILPNPKVFLSKEEEEELAHA
ncbi:isoaspartyl peptidase/L-asparaginase family protein [Chelativorans sp.]|uniref:isoaspartyl peptidase/L-asparaginase family protein n=1 Tax=Chelativorans sp. TaxID=2203393 RepID=UPI002810F404|nr:isoaspartyl peptidase/L-asparaginase family protein [Chelativorans sp.]